MCGIAGVVGDRGSELRSAALGLQCHRGPDASGEVTPGSGIWLGHNRLSIIDLEAGQQPMSNEDRSLWLVFNGEIFNYVELREELRSLGHTFRTSSDTEVILCAYEQWGVDCQRRFNGMWAFALWDDRAKRLFCSRDRFGVKPFVYAQTSAGFVFASEIKTLLEFDHSLAVSSEARIFRFLRTGLLAEDEGTFFRAVEQLRPGHYLLLEPGGAPQMHRYYDLTEAIAPLRLSQDEVGERFRELLSDSVKLRLRSDVPVGTCLSGGLDSSSIVALMATMSDEPVHTFTSVYPGTDSDEGAYAHMVAHRYGTTAHWIEPRMDDFADIVPRITWHQDSPTSAPGLYSQWHVMKLASENVTVLLDGQGADEILGGYTSAYTDYVASMLLDGQWGRLARDHAEIREQLGGANPLLSAVRPLLPVSLKRLGRRYMRGTQLMTEEFRAAWADTEPPPVRTGLLGDRFNSGLYDALTRISLPALLHYEDRNSMAFSIEARTPFLDYRLVEYCFSLPYTSKISGWRTKVPLRDGMRELLPAEVLGRRDKKGFPTPMALWLRNGLMPWVREVLLAEQTTSRGVTDTVAVKALLDEHEAGRADYHPDIWRLLTLELWYRSFIDGEGPVRP